MIGKRNYESINGGLRSNDRFALGEHRSSIETAVLETSLSGARGRHHVRRRESLRRHGTLHDLRGSRGRRSSLGHGRDGPIPHPNSRTRRTGIRSHSYMDSHIHRGSRKRRGHSLDNYRRRGMDSYIHTPGLHRFRNGPQRQPSACRRTATSPIEQRSGDPTCLVFSSAYPPSSKAHSHRLPLNWMKGKQVKFPPTFLLTFRLMFAYHCQVP